MTTKPHVHAELIKAWADGAKIQVKDLEGKWTDVDPMWHEDSKYRIKPTLITKSLPVLKIPFSDELYIGARSYKPSEVPKEYSTGYVLKFDILGDIPSNPRFVKI